MVKKLSEEIKDIKKIFNSITNKTLNRLLFFGYFYCVIFVFDGQDFDSFTGNSFHYLIFAFAAYFLFQLAIRYNDKFIGIIGIIVLSGNLHMDEIIYGPALRFYTLLFTIIIFSGLIIAKNINK